jgi:hypothetical protein
MLNPPHQIIESLTTSNLQKHTLSANETPRTKVSRYFSQVEDPQILSRREPTPTQLAVSDPWDPSKDFMPGIFIVRKLIIGGYKSPILGLKVNTRPLNQMNNVTTAIVNRVFESEDSDILAPNTNKQNIRKGDTGPEELNRKRNRDDGSSACSWSDSQHHDVLKGLDALDSINGRERL